MFSTLPLGIITYFLWLVYMEVVMPPPEARRIFFEVKKRDPHEIKRWEKILAPIIGPRELEGKRASIRRRQELCL